MVCNACGPIGLVFGSQIASSIAYCPRESEASPFQGFEENAASVRMSTRESLESGRKDCNGGITSRSDIKRAFTSTGCTYTA